MSRRWYYNEEVRGQARWIIFGCVIVAILIIGVALK